MSRPLLLIVDGESMKSPALVAALESDGWDIRWATSKEAKHYIEWGLEPSLIILDPVHGGEAPLDVARLFLARFPSLPVLELLGEDTVPRATLPVGLKGYLTRNEAATTWPASVRLYKPNLSRASGKFSSDDIFGDLLSDLEGPSPSSPELKALPKATPPPPPPPPAVHKTPSPPAAPASPVALAPKPVATKPVIPKIQLPKINVPAPKPPAVPKINVNALTRPTARPGAATAAPQAAPAAASHAAPASVGGATKPVQAMGQAVQPVPSPVAPIEPFVPPPPRPPAPKAAFESEDIFGSLLAELEGESVAASAPPSPAPAPAPALPPSPAREGKPKPLEALTPFEAPAMGTPATGEDDEFTLSGLSGIHDPFAVEAEAAGGPGPAAPQPPAPRPPAPRPESTMGMQAFPDMSEPRPSNVLEEYGNYYLLEKIAVGGMAELFKAKQRGVQGFQKIVAIKRILPHLSDNDEFVTMFIDEAKLAAQLTHPNIVQIFDLGKASGSYYIAMEFVDGRDLRSLLRKVREYRLPFPEPVAAFVAMKVAVALDHAHRKKGLNDKELKLVHRDISPQNILISYDGAVKLVDFGIAKAASKNTQTLAGALKGKLLYMSPEQALGQPLDNRSDLYSLGLVLFELLTGERCFQADSELGVLEKVRMGRVSDVQALNPNISREMTAIVNKCLQKSVESRYPSARFLERDLKDLLVRQGSEPTDHDVAEYVNALLKGTKDQVEEVLAARFAIRSIPTPATPWMAEPPSGEQVKSQMEDQPTAAMPKKPIPIPIPLPEMETMEPGRPAWLIPSIIAVILLLIFLFIIYGMATRT